MCLNEASELGLIRSLPKSELRCAPVGSTAGSSFPQESGQEDEKPSEILAGGQPSVVLKPVPGLKWICLLLPYSRCPHLPWDWKPGAAGSSFPSQMCPWFLKWFRAHCRYFISLQNERMWTGVTPSLWTSGKSRCPLKTLFGTNIWKYWPTYIGMGVVRSLISI